MIIAYLVASFLAGKKCRSMVLDHLFFFCKTSRSISMDVTSQHKPCWRNIMLLINVRKHCSLFVMIHGDKACFKMLTSKFRYVRTWILTLTSWNMPFSVDHHIRLSSLKAVLDLQKSVRESLSDVLIGSPKMEIFREPIKILFKGCPWKRF